MELHPKPLRVMVKDTSFSHPQNFVIIQKNDRDRGNPTHVDNSAGAWMNQGGGGDMNTIDLQLQLEDADGNPVRECEVIPLKCLLFYYKNGKVSEKVVDEVNQATAEDKTGKMVGERGILMVSGKPTSLLQINNNGTGMLSVRILETSSVHDRKKFCMEVVPDTDEKRVLSMFHKNSGGLYDETVDPTSSYQPVVHRGKSLSKCLTVMSKMNKSNKGDIVPRVRSQLASAAKLLKHRSSEKMNDATLVTLIKDCEKIRALLLRGARLKNIELESDTALKNNHHRDTTLYDEEGRTAKKTRLATPLDNSIPELAKPSSLSSLPGTGDVYPATPMKQEMNPLRGGGLVQPVPLAKMEATHTPFGGHDGYTLLDGVLGGSHPPAAGATHPTNSLLIPNVDDGIVDITDQSFDDFIALLNDNTHGIIVECDLSPEGLFFKLDLSKEGWLNEGEISHALKVLRIPLSSQIARQFMDACDKDKDGKISKDEFLRYLQQREQQLRRIFDSIDQNRSGYITFEELLVARDQQLVSGSDGDMKHLIEWMDSVDDDRNERVDFNEFKTALTLLPPSTTLSCVVDLMRKHAKR